MNLLRALSLAVALCPLVAGAQDGLTLSDAVRLALQKNSVILIQHNQARAAAGAATQARGPFDTVVSAGVGAQRDQRLLRADEQLKYPSAGAEQVIQSENLRLGVDRLLESGTQLGVAYTYNAAIDNVQGAQNIPLQAGDKLSFSLRLPLQRNIGREAAVSLAAAQAEARAVRLDTEHTVAGTVLAVAQGYWDWAARLAGWRAASRAEERMARLVHETEKLVQTDELPPAEVNLVRASLLERGTARMAAEQRSLEARHTLGRLFGMNAGQANRLPVPAEDLPEQSGPIPDLAGLHAMALAMRRDIEAARTREGGAQARLEVAHSSLRPQADLVLSGYQAGLREGSRFGNGLPLVAQSSGPGVAATLVFQLPMENSVASGALDTAYANLDSARLRRSTLEDAISVALEQAHALLRTAATQLERSRDVVERYRIAVRNEEIKRQLGTATLIDVLNIEDRLNNALVARLQYQQAYAAALAQLQFEAGRLVHVEAGEQYSINLQALLPVMPPQPGGAGRP